MTKTIISTLTTIMDEDRKVLSVREEESYLLKAAKGKILMYKPTEQIFGESVCEYKQYKLKDYIEIEDPKTSI